LKTFLEKFENCSRYLNWSEKDRFFHLSNALEGTAGQVLWDAANCCSVEALIQLLRSRFGNQNQNERFRAELKSRRRKPGESLQGLDQITLATQIVSCHLVQTKRAPQYLSDSLQTVARSSSRPGLRSTNAAVYVKPRCRTKFGERGFSHAGPTAWNSLPHHLHQISDNGLFKRGLKTEIFRRAYIASC